MITNASMLNFKPSFGMAKLSPQGATAAQAYGYPSNVDSFLNGDMFCKQKGSTKKTPIGKAADSGVKFEQIATDYGCSDNPTANANFIKHCILSKKGQKATKNLPQTDRDAAYAKLLDKNYDNPNLSAKDTLALLKLCEAQMSPADYYKLKAVLTDAK